MKERPLGKKEKLKKSSVTRLGLLWRIKRYLPNVLRVTALLGFVYIVAVLFIAHEARAQVSEVLMGMGIEMLRYEDAERQDAPRTLHLNGTPIRLASGLTTHGLDRVLDYYEARCQEHDGRFAEQIEEMARDNPDIGELDGDLFDATLREQDENRGFVACLDTGTERLDTDGVMERLQRFRSTVDLAEFGDMRYIYAEESEGTTLFVAFWTEGELKVLDMFPAQGDAPGRDVDGVPRPPQGRRILSTWEEGEPQSVTMYADSPMDPEGLEAFYRDLMPEQGWHLLELPDRVLSRMPEERRPRHFLVWERDDEMVSTAFGTAESGLSTTTVLTH